MILANKFSRQECFKRLAQEVFKRRTISFYRYVRVADPASLRDRLYAEWSRLGVLGRVYLAHEGINAQISVPEPNWARFQKKLGTHPEFKKMMLKERVKEGISFWKLTIKVKLKIVADGLPEKAYDVTNVGRYLTAKEFNKALEFPETIVVDMRNNYESRIGKFEKALCPPVETFSEALPKVRQMLKGKKDKKILLYCTGGIRCEKASAYLRAYGFKDINQLHGGIIQYAHEVRRNRLPCRFKGANFVFDGRMSERITKDVLTNCDQCDTLCDQYSDCAYNPCNRLFIQCEKCKTKFENCCSGLCQKRLGTSEKRCNARKRGASEGDVRSRTATKK